MSLHKILQVDYHWPGPFGKELAAQQQDMARALKEEHAMVWKIWTEAPERQRAGGLYLFEDRDALRRFRDRHIPLLEGAGASDIRVLELDVNEPLTDIDHGPIHVL